MLKRVLTVLLVVSLVGVLGVLGFSQKKVTVAVLWSGAELEAFEKTLAPFEAETGIDVVVESVGRDLPAVLVTRLAAGNPPDVAAMPNPGQMKEFADQGVLVALDGIVDLSDSSKAFVDLGSVDDHVYGLFISADLKSLVWYNPKAFAAKGYEVPTSWAELIDLCNRIVADGGTPWALGMESGAASGWVGTDWIEDIMLRTAGPDLYDKWVNHEISWTHPAVKKAFEYFGQIVNEPGYIYGGATGALTINFGDSPNALFTDPPGAYMHRQATFIQSFIKKANPDLVAGEDYDVFPFPPISPVFGNPLLGAGDLISAFNDTPETRALLNYLASAKAQEIWCAALGKLAINKTVDPSIYPDPITAKAAGMLAEAETFRFDGSDLMPAAVGAGTFWSGVLDYVSGIPLDTVLESIEASAADAYTK
jgi:alpha-glucoside transport system substrate-binding protein